jgi:hypothetical protein
VDFSRELSLAGAFLNTGACRTPISSIRNNVGAGLPLVVVLALPEKLRAVGGVGGRKAFPSTRGSDFLHLFDCVSFLNAFAFRTPLSSGDMVGRGLPYMAFRALPEKLRSGVDIGCREAFPSPRGGQFLQLMEGVCLVAVLG